MVVGWEGWLGMGTAMGWEGMGRVVGWLGMGWHWWGTATGWLSLLCLPRTQTSPHRRLSTHYCSTTLNHQTNLHRWTTHHCSTNQTNQQRSVTHNCSTTHRRCHPWVIASVGCDMWRCRHPKCARGPGGGGNA